MEGICVVDGFSVDEVPVNVLRGMKKGFQVSGNLRIRDGAEVADVTDGRVVVEVVEVSVVVVGVVVIVVVIVFVVEVSSFGETFGL